VAQKASERLGGVSVQLPHLDKAFFPGDGISKEELPGFAEGCVHDSPPFLR